MCQHSNIPCSCGCSTPTLGLVATSKRNIKSGKAYDQYFPLSGVTGTEKQVATGSQKRSLEEMEKVVKRTLNQTKGIARKMKASNLINTLSNIWHFVYDHIQYTLDASGREQLREPARTWKDRAFGVDCDCYSIFISSILHNLGIPHAFRMTKYTGDWQHVYIVVPKDGKLSSLGHRNQYFVVDPVVDQFNYEVPFTSKHDKFMKMPITVLSGVGQTSCGKPERSLDYISIAAIERAGKYATEKLLKEVDLPYSQEFENGTPMLAVVTDEGTVKLPTILTKDQAALIKASITKPNSEGDEIMTITNTPNQAGGMGNGWIWALLAIGVGVVILAGNKPKTPGLTGAPKARKKPGKRKSSPIKISI